MFGGNGPQGRFSGHNPLSLHTRSLARYTIDTHEPSFWKRHPFSAIELKPARCQRTRVSGRMTVIDFRTDGNHLDSWTKNKPIRELDATAHPSAAAQSVDVGVPRFLPQVGSLT